MFISTIEERNEVQIPSFNGAIGDKLYMIPFTWEDLSKIPNKWRSFLLSIKDSFPKFKGKAFLTVDQKLVLANKPHRRAGRHTDGNYIQDSWGGGGWLNGVSGINNTPEQHKEMYLTKGLGTLIMSDYSSCIAWNKEFVGEPNHGGNCEHLKDQADYHSGIMLKENTIYLMGSQCVHESLPIKETTKRSLVRITLPIS